MTESEKLLIKPLDDKDDYRLWRIRIFAACEGKGLEDVLHTSQNPHTEDEQKKVKFDADKKKASNIIIRSLSDMALRIVRADIGNPVQMLKKLDERFDSKSAASRIAKMTELISLRYDTTKRSVAKHIDQMAGTLEQLQGMNTPIPDELCIALLIASIQAPEMFPITAALKTLTDENATWEKVTARLIEEHQTLRGKHRIAERATPVRKHCDLCKKSGHSLDRCWLNPKNPNNRLNFSTTDGQINKADTGIQATTAHVKEEKKSKSKKTRTAVARAMVSRSSRKGLLMLDSGTTSDMTNSVATLQDARQCKVPIALGDDSEIKASHCGTRKVTWASQNGVTDVTLSNTLASKDLAMSLLSVPALTEKGLCVLFLPDKAVILDMENDLSVVGIAPKNDDGLYYIQSDESIEISRHLGTFAVPRAMMAVVREHMDESIIDVRSMDSDVTTTSSETDYYSSDDVPSLLSSEDEYETDSESCESESESEISDDGDSIDIEALPITNGAERSNNHHGGSGRQSTQFKDEMRAWHNRLGHLGSDKDISDMISAGIIPSAKSRKENCDPCMKGKFRRFFRGSLTKAENPGSIHADLVGRVNPASHEGYEYFLTIIDELTRYAEIVPLRTKSEASAALLRFMKRFERQTSERLKSLHIDGGSECSKARTHFESEGVRVTTSTPYAPSSNGLAERTQGVLLSLARTCLIEANIPLKYWVEALQHVTKARNLVPHSVTGKSPHMFLFESVPAYAKHMRPFGCRVLFSPNRKRKPKFSARLVEGINLGHVDGGQYKILTAEKIIVTKHVKILEEQFPGLSLLSIAYNTGPVQTKTPQRQDDEDAEINLADWQKDIDLESDSTTSSNSDSDSSDEDDDTGEDPDSPGQEINLDALTHVPPVPSTHGNEEDSDETDGAQTQIGTAPEHGNDHLRSSGTDNKGDHEATAGRGSATGKGHGYSLRPRANTALPKVISTGDEPSLKDALASPEASFWKQAINEEFETIQSAGTYKETESTPTRALPSGIILRLKRDEDGKPARFKARLVARGNLQTVTDSSYASRYAPVACFDLVRILLVLSAAFGWSRHQVDVKGAFLYSKLPETTNIFLRLPSIDGVPGATGNVVKLLKSLYGLREAPKLWYSTLANALKSLGFKRLISSECLFALRRGKNKVILLSYVDDLALFGDEGLIIWVKEKLKSLFKITDLGKSKYFLGVAIVENAENITLTQAPMIEKLLEAVNMSTCKPAKTPLPLSHVLYECRTAPTPAEIKEMVNVPYQEVLGSLLYLSTRTRPDISTAVSMLGKFSSAPAPRHWKAMKQVVRYLQGTKQVGLVFKKGCDGTLEAWSDADWARDQDKRRSRSGIVLTIGGNPVSWTSKLQPSVALSTCEAEFYALSECVREVNWVRQVLKELGFDTEEPTCVYQDNLGTIRWTDEVQGLRKVKHVGIRYHSVKETVEHQSVQVLYTPSQENKADSLTKALVGSSFEKHCQLLHVAPASSRGGVSK